MMSPCDRYQYDQMFRHLVDSLYAVIEDAKYTPTEIREAAMLAQTMYEEKHIRTRVYIMEPGMAARERALNGDPT